jgi:hypothetical protein
LGIIKTQEEKEVKMMDREKISCVKAVKGPIKENPTETMKKSDHQSEAKEEFKMLAKVGSPAPDFEASAFVNGGFENVKLSDYKGQWISLCFYPGDFTFV